MTDRVGLVGELRAVVDPQFVIADAETRRPFECDGLAIYRQMPMLVVLPGSADEVAQVMRICHRHNVPAVARGAGTGLSAGAMPHGEGVLLGLSRLAAIRAIDPLARTARVEPGVTNLSISQAAAPFGLYYGPDPSSQIACTIGGNVAENAGGVHCLKYGLTVHNVLAAKLVTVEGEILELGGPAQDAAGYDLMALITGSEGLLGVLVEVTVKLLPTPERAQVVVAGFATLRQAGDAVERLIGEGIIPAGLEMMDGLAIRAAEDFAHAGYPTEAEALLLCEVDGSAAEVAAQIARVDRVMRSFDPLRITVSQSEAERAALWKGRKSAFPAVGRISPDYYCMDGTIPKRELSNVLEGIARLSRHYGLRVANVFHAGDGNLHPLILFDASKPGETERTEEFGARILELCVKAGGCITGEHGVGLEKIRQMPAQFSDAEIAQFLAIKAAFDPTGALNPGKGVPLLAQCREYRAVSGARF
ncbi:MAG: FAD-binding protein [Rhodospirillales bacterium]|nr:FAD-binding protein [Rhodospirillales bacterium]